MKKILKVLSFLVVTTLMLASCGPLPDADYESFAIYSNGVDNGCWNGTPVKTGSGLLGFHLVSVGNVVFIVHNRIAFGTKGWVEDGYLVVNCDLGSGEQ